VRDLEQLRLHYPLTLRRWLANLERHHEGAVFAASEADYRIWRAYIAGALVGFETSDMAVIQLLAHKPGPPGTEPPLTRRRMLLEPREIGV
jgi:cyclopropane-fatty-acyl-phospholipid synthase